MIGENIGETFFIMLSHKSFFRSYPKQLNIFLHFQFAYEISEFSVKGGIVQRDKMLFSYGVVDK